MKHTICFSAFKKALFSFAFLCLIFPVQAKEKKVVFIIVDGVPADVLERVSTPTIDEIASKGSYTQAYMGGEVNGFSQTPTVSAVCYNSLLTSTWVNKHNVWGNDVKDPNYNYWNIFRIAQSQPKKKTTAIFSGWEENRTRLAGENQPKSGVKKIDYVLDGLDLDKEKYPPEANSMQIFKIDEAVTDAAALCIRKDAPDVTWLYLWYLDCVGHEQGTGKVFDTYVQKADDQVRRIWEAVKYREKEYNEEWMIVVTTDHGRTSPDGHGHGGQSPRERTTWISTNVKPNSYFTSQQPGIIDIVPSICRFMKLKTEPSVEREFDGVPFYGKISLSGLKAERKGNKISLKWDAYDSAPAEIWITTTNHYKTGGKDHWIKAGRTKADKENFDIDVSSSPSDFYKIWVKGKHNGTTTWITKL